LDLEKKTENRYQKRFPAPHPSIFQYVSLPFATRYAVEGTCKITRTAIRISTEDPREFNTRRPSINGERRCSMPRIQGRIRDMTINGAKLMRR
jgi:hypothetical protein